MADTKGIIGTFRTLGKTGQAVFYPNTVHLSGPASQYFMWIGLVTDIPDNFIIGGIKDAMQCNG